MVLPSPFLIEDEEALLRAYPGEACLAYPFVSSARRIPYVALLGAEAGDAEVICDERVWAPSPAVKDATEEAFRAWRRVTHADLAPEARGVRLAAVGPSLQVQPVNYESYARTNLVIDYAAPESLRAIVNTLGKLEPLAQSALANPIGVNILAVNADGDVPLQVRSARTALRPNAICSTGSGGMEWRDIPAQRCRLSQCRLMRELEEEFGAMLASCLETPEVVGVARELSRGGQPEVFVVAEGAFTREDVLRSVSEAADTEVDSVLFLRLPRVGQKFDAAGVSDAIVAFERDYGDRVTPPLRAHFSLWFQALARTQRLSEP